MKFVVEDRGIWNVQLLRGANPTHSVRGSVLRENVMARNDPFSIIFYILPKIKDLERHEES